HHRRLPRGTDRVRLLVVGRLDGRHDGDAGHLWPAASTHPRRARTDRSRSNVAGRVRAFHVRGLLHTRAARTDEHRRSATATPVVRGAAGATSTRYRTVSGSTSIVTRFRISGISASTVLIAFR